MKNHKYIKVKIIDLHGGASAPEPEADSWSSLIAQGVKQGAEYIWNNWDAVVDGIEFSAEVYNELKKIYENKTKPEPVRFFELALYIEENKDKFKNKMLKDIVNFLKKLLPPEYHEIFNNVTDIEMLIFRLKELKKIYDNFLIIILIISAHISLGDAYLKYYSVSNTVKTINTMSDFIIETYQVESYDNFITNFIVNFYRAYMLKYTIDDIEEKISKILNKLIDVNTGPLKDFAVNLTTPGYIWLNGWIRTILQILSNATNIILFGIILAPTGIALPRTGITYVSEPSTFGTPVNLRGGANLPINPNDIDLRKYLRLINNSFLGKIPQKLLTELILDKIPVLIFRFLVIKLTFLNFYVPELELIINDKYLNMLDQFLNQGNYYSLFYKEASDKFKIQKYLTAKKLINGIINLTNINEMWYNFIKSSIAMILFAYVYNVTTTAAIGAASTAITAATSASKITSKNDFVSVLIAMIYLAALMIPLKLIYNSILKIKNPQIENSNNESESENNNEGIVTKDPKIFESILLQMIPIILDKIPKIKSKEEFNETANKIINIGLLELNKLEDKTPKKEVETDIDITEE